MFQISQKQKFSIEQQKVNKKDTNVNSEILCFLHFEVHEASQIQQMIKHDKAIDRAYFLVNSLNKTIAFQELSTTNEIFVTMHY